LVFASVTTAQSPAAHNPAWPGTASVLSTITPPRLSRSTGSVASSGCGFVPAVQTSVSASISSPVDKVTAPGRASATRVSSLNVTPRSDILSNA